MSEDSVARGAASGSERVLAVVIGRAGSKGLPGKNARLLAGKPMVAHTIGHALDARLVGRTVLSTDGAEIADVGTSMGIEVVKRPAALADDHATVDAAVRHAVEASRSNAPVVVILYANVPVRPVGLIDRAIRTLESTGADSVQSYERMGKTHPLWMVTLGDAGEVRAYQENRVYRRQDLPPVYLPDGGVIAVRRESLFAVVPGQPHAFLGRDRRGIENPAGSVIDVDSELDLRVATAILEGAPTARARGMAEAER